MLVAVEPRDGGADLDELVVLEGDAHVAGHGGDGKGRVAVEDQSRQLVLNALGELRVLVGPLWFEHIHAHNEAVEVREPQILERRVVDLVIPLRVVVHNFGGRVRAMALVAR